MVEVLMRATYSAGNEANTIFCPVALQSGVTALLDFSVTASGQPPFTQFTSFISNGALYVAPVGTVPYSSSSYSATYYFHIRVSTTGGGSITRTVEVGFDATRNEKSITVFYESPYTSSYQSPVSLDTNSDSYYIYEVQDRFTYNGRDADGNDIVIDNNGEYWDYTGNYLYEGRTISPGTILLINSNTTLLADVTEKYYSIEISDVKSGSTYPDGQVLRVRGGTTFNPGSTGTLPAHYLSTHWYYYGDFPINTNITARGENQHCTAMWVGETYTTTYNTDGSTTSVTTTYPNTTTLPSRSKTHYTFDGWYDASTGGNKIGNSGASYQPTSNKTLYARFIGVTYTVTYVADGSQTTTDSAQYPNKVTLPSRTKTHYNFLGWYSGNTRVGGAGDEYQPSSNITLNAGFDGIEYTTTFSTTGTAVTPSSVESKYPATITLPSTSKQYYDFNGWYTASTGGTRVGGANSVITPDTTRILYAQFSLHEYDIHFIDADGNNLSPDVHYTDAVNGTPVNVPTAPVRTPLFTFVGWRNMNTSQIVNSATVNPTEDVVYKAVYDYSLTLKSINLDGNGDKTEAVYSTLTGRYPNSPSIPNSVNYLIRGYRFAGWSFTSNKPDKDHSYPTTTFVLSLSDTRNTLYTVWNPAVLESVSIPSIASISENEVIEISVENGSIVISPEDWLGSLSWTRRQESSSYFSIRDVSGDGKKIQIEGLNGTNTNIYTIYASAPSQSWNPSSEVVSSNDMQVAVSHYIAVSFYTRNDMGAEVEYHQIGHSGNIWYVEEIVTPTVPPTISYEWVDSLPDDPQRAGYTFAGWVSREGQMVSDDAPPHYPVDCYAIWLPTYVPRERDTVILQQTIPNGDNIEMQVEMNLTTDMGERFNISLKEVPTPTMSSENTFITDMYCTESVTLEFIRKSPEKYNDSTDDSTKWSNGKWISVVRGLVDRWQANTDGIKLLYIPFGMRTAEINGELICYGQNYDMLGYIKPREYIEGGVTKYNDGLLYHRDEDDKDYVLVGYNGIVTAFVDDYTAGNPNVIAVSMTVTLGGMVSMYQDWAKGMLLQ